MTLIGAALAAGRARPFRSTVARLAAALFSFVTYSAAGPAAGEIDYSTLPMSSPLARFRDRRALAITDITATEWCQKQMEFVLEHGKPERTEAMKAGSDRHAQLEKETFEDVVKYFKITCHTLQRLQSQEQLLLRYELQADDSLLEEYQFTYDARWFKDQIHEVFSFWHGSREPKFVTDEER
nr:unnamed protein product [Digitaria exilis]